MKIAIILFSLLVLSGCVNQAQIAERSHQNDMMNLKLNSSLANTLVSCDTQKMCDKAFSLAKIFIQENADMKIQTSDDTIVSTFGPIKYGMIAMSATKTPGAGDSAEIKLNVTCKGLSYPVFDSISTLCKQRVKDINNQFRPYIESKLK